MSKILKPLASKEGQDNIALAIRAVGNDVINAGASAFSSAENAAESEANALTYMNAAQASSANAATYATNANNTAAALTSFLETKESLTAPAVDATLAVSGAAADAFVTGEKLKSAIRLTDAVIYPPFVAGRNINSNGSIGNNNRRIATVNFTDIQDVQAINYTVQEGYRTYLFFYSSDNEGSFTHNSGGWLTGSGTIYRQNNDNYLRMSLASIDDEIALTVDDANKVAVTYKPIIVSSLLNYTLQYRHGLNNSHNLDDITTVGMYNLANLSRPTNCPEGFSGGTLLVMNSYDTTEAYLNARQTLKTQFLISPYDRNIWMRYQNAYGDWRDWTDIVKTAATVMPLLVEQTKWLAIGDSITRGVYSDSDGSHDSTSGWVKMVSDSFGFDLNNKGVRGMGYKAVGGNGITFEQTLQAVEALQDDYNLVTVALGINDYNSSYSLASLELVIKNSIERLAAKFPKARLVYITPFNSNRRGDASTKYCFNYPNNGRSLKDVADLIKSCCAVYGVECIYASDGFLMNTYNMATLLPDMTHPSIDGHKLIAKTMSHLLFY